MKNNQKFKWIAILLVTLVLIPWLFQKLINIESNQMGSNDGWLGFWGGYLGSIIGVVGAVYIFNSQMKKESEVRRTEITDNTFFNLLSLHNEQQARLLEKEVFKNIILLQEKYLEIEISEEGVEYFYAKKHEFIPVIRGLQTRLQNYMDKTEKRLTPGDTFYERWERLKKRDRFSDSYGGSGVAIIYDDLQSAINFYDSLSEFNKDVNCGKILSWKSPYGFGILDKVNGVAISTNLFFKDSCNDSIYNLYNDLQRFNKNNYHLLSQNRRKQAIELSIVDNYSEIGSFLRTFHRIVKYINENVTDEKTKKNYIGFLRATLNETEILVIFYNAIYTKKGQGLLEQLKQTTFFGEKEEFDETDAPPFVSRNKLYFQEDFEYMRDLNQASELWKDITK